MVRVKFGPQISCREVLDRYDFVFPDLCIGKLYGTSGVKHPFCSDECARRAVEMQHNASWIYEWLLNGIELKKIYLTALLRQEWECKIGQIRVGVKKLAKMKGALSGKKLELARLIEHERKLERMLVGAASDNGNVIVLTPEEQEDYAHVFREPERFQAIYELSDVDFDLLRTGIVLSRSRGRTAILSNDMGLANAWGNYCKGGGINPEQLGFFRRSEKEKFETGRF